MLRYTAIIERGRESGYVATCPALRGCVAQGRTKASALANLRAAMRDYIECLVENGIAVPTEVAKETVEVLVSAK